MHHTHSLCRVKRLASAAFIVSCVAFAMPNVSFAETASSVSAPMSLSEMEALVNSLLAMVDSLTKQIADLASSRTMAPAAIVSPSSTDGVGALSASSPVFANVNIENGKLTSSHFSFKHFQPASLSFYAVDADYTVSVADSGNSITIKKGTKAEVSFDGLGVGDHALSCGAVCSGSIAIESDADEGE